MKVSTILAAMISLSVLADQPAVAPAAKTAPKQTAPEPELRTVPLLPGPAVVVARRVNVRGRAGLAGEVVAKLTNGEPVTVVEEVALKHSKPDEPSAWAKILLPPTVKVWVHKSYLDAAMTVKATKLNLRAGPGENFSIIGSLQKGDAVKELQTKGDWTEIEPPAGAYAFVAAQYLKQEAPAIVANTPEPTPAEPATVTETPPVAPAGQIPVEIPTNTVAETVMGTNDLTAVTATNELTSVSPVVEEAPLPPRIVLREGIVRNTISIQAPTRFELVSPDNFRPINYLYTTSTNLDLSRYKGLHIVVTGEEGLDERWRNTPVITIQRIQVLE